MVIIGVKIKDRTGEESDFQTFSLFEVNYVTVLRPKKSAELLPVYHTPSGSYSPLLTLKDISSALKRYNFEHFDKSTIVNKSRVKHVRTTNGVVKVRFVDGSEIEISARSRYR